MTQARRIHGNGELPLSCWRSNEVYTVNRDRHENDVAHFSTTAERDVIAMIACFVILILLAAWVSY
jgi:hypothetical protein